MTNMKRVLMFTAYELIICVTPRAARSELALSGKKQLYQEKNRRPFHPRLHGVQVGFTVRNPTHKNVLFFLKVSTNLSVDECETMLSV